MADVACFCGCFFSFDRAGAVTCPQCGQAAGVTSDSGSDGHAPHEHDGPVPEVRVISQTSRSPETGQDLEEIIARYCGEAFSGRV